MYLKEGIQIIELANDVYNLYLEQSSEEKAELLKILLSNSWLNNGKLDYDYKKTFDILAKGIALAVENNEPKPPSHGDSGQNINRPQINDGGLWWRRRDSNPRPERISANFYECRLLISSS